MIYKKKISFWRLTFVFTALTVIVLVLLWSTPQGSTSSMMSGSMGNMMKQMHVSNITIYDLFSNAEMSEQMQEMHSHHQGQAPIIYSLNFIATSIIFLLLPFIIGGTIILAIVWIR